MPGNKGKKASEDPPLSEWSDRLEGVCRQCARLGVVGVRVVAETASTQEAAWEAGGGRPGWLVVAGRQTAGRGRLGRSWADTDSWGLAMTMTFSAGAVSSVQVGVAVCRAVNAVLPVGDEIGGTGVAGLRWPNDVVEREGGRKIAGVLIEVRDGVAAVGVGVNVLQLQADFDAELAGRAVSIRHLGGTQGRLDVACEVLKHLDAVVGEDASETVREAMTLDTIVGTRRRFCHDGREYAGLVTALGPDGTIDLVLDGGGIIELPAQTTSLVHE
jgi:BirA family biotin operon repressor/biotin-[acetyl-CoA-carboxylase] ligase